MCYKHVRTDRLVGKGIDWTGCAHLRLITDHVAKTLIIHQANKNIGTQLSASDAAIHGLATNIIVAGL